MQNVFHVSPVHLLIVLPCVLFCILLCLWANLCSCIATSTCMHANVTVVIDALVVVFWT